MRSAWAMQLGADPAQRAPTRPKTAARPKRREIHAFADVLREHGLLENRRALRIGGSSKVRVPNKKQNKVKVHVHVCT